jgi:hypothetical protein
MFIYFTLRRGMEFAKSELEFCAWAMDEIDRHRALFSGDDAASEVAPRKMSHPAKSKAIL